MKCFVIALCVLCLVPQTQATDDEPIRINYWEQPQHGGRDKAIQWCKQNLFGTASTRDVISSPCPGDIETSDIDVTKISRPQRTSTVCPAPVIIFCGNDANAVFPADLILRRGYAVVRVAPDTDGVRRAIDVLMHEKNLDTQRIAVVGVGSVAKTVLWAAANDERIACVAVLGASAHEKLLQLIAPRLLYVVPCTSKNRKEAEATFLSIRRAARLWETAYGLPGLGIKTYPNPDFERGDGRIGFYESATPHSITRTGWVRYLDFVDRHLGKPATAADAPCEPASPFKVTVSSEPKLPVVNYVKNGDYELGFKTYVFGPGAEKIMAITNDAYEGDCALWTAKGCGHSINTRGVAPPGTTNRIAITVKLGPEHKGLTGLGAGFSQSYYAAPSTGGKLVPFAASGVNLTWQQAGSYTGWQRIESEPFVVPPDATNIVMNIHAGSLCYCATGGIVDNLFCGPAWTDLSFVIENTTGLAQVTVEDENGDRVFCADAFPENLTRFERTIKVSAAMRYCVKSVDRKAQSIAKWYPSPRPDSAAARAPLSVKGLRRLWPSNEKAAVFLVEMRDVCELAGASLVAAVTATNGVEVMRKTFAPVLMQNRIEIPITELADGCYQLVASYHDAKGAAVTAKAPVDFWKFPAMAGRPRDIYTIKDRNIYKNGRFFFPIFTWGGFPGWGTLRNHRFDTNAYIRCCHDAIAEQKALGFNAILTDAWYFPDLARRAFSEIACRKYFPAWIPYTQVSQIPLDFLDIARMYDVDAWLKAVVNYRNADNILCWHLSDELDAAIAHNRMLNDLHHEADPDRLTWINFINGARNNRDNGDILSEDPYPIPNERIAKVIWHAEKVRDCTRPDQSVFQWLQMFGGEGTWTRSPTIAELEGMVYMSLNHGVRGLAYFGYTYSLADRDGIRSMTEADYAKLGTLNRRVERLAPIYCLGQALERVYDNNLHYDRAVFRYAGRIWVSVVNGLPEARHLRIPLPQDVKRVGKAEVVDDNRQISFKDGAIEEKFLPYAVRLYRLK